jgi:pimeloyl-ACP methyl ester carboxylesterase
LKSLLLTLSVVLAGCASSPSRQYDQIDSARIGWLATGTGLPVVVLQSGLGDDASPWAALTRRVAASRTVFAYDRPGYGASKPGPRDPKDACMVARELRATLQATGHKPPYLLVGHSLGGQYQYAFARLFPDEVAGLILLDPTHPDHWTTMQQRAPGSAKIISGLRALMFSATMRAEFDGQGKCLEQRAPWSVTFPVRLLVRTQYEAAESGAFRGMVQDLEQDWLNLMPGATRVSVEGSGHYMQREKPEVIASEILSLGSD